MTAICYYLAVLDPEMVLMAYRRGIFPMAVDKRGRIGWFSPDPRAVIPLDHRFHVPHGLRRVLKRKKFEITSDTDFETVIRECARRKEGTWISPGIIDSYCRLHRLGQAHTIETRLDGRLVGGLYGVALGGAFFGESMFHRVTDASKLALVALVQRLRARGFVLLDTQWATPHLRQFGACEIPRQEYLWQLQQALMLDRQF
jgi:leucyl/phenylalanyl-tRNA--protein transferase